MSWIPFTEDDIKARLATREVEVYEETAKAEYPPGGGDAVVPGGTPDRLPAITAQVLALFRGAIRSNPAVTYMGPAGTLPDFCIFSAATIGSVALIGLDPTPEGMTDPRRDAYRDANTFLKDLRTMGQAAFLESDTIPAAPAGCGASGGQPLIQF